MDPNLIANGAVWYVVFLFSLTCHEAAHALVAKWGGDPTAFRGGQVTLNPIPHMRREVFGTIIMPSLSDALGGWMIGWASAPYDPRWRERHPAVRTRAGPLLTDFRVHGAGVKLAGFPLQGWRFGRLVFVRAGAEILETGGITEVVPLALIVVPADSILLGDFHPADRIDDHFVLSTESGRPRARAVP
jgi:hypothetical protein